MKVRPLVGTDGDMVPVRSLRQMREGPEAVAQIIAMRIALNRGEWWEDEDIGFQIPDFLAETARQEDLNLLAKYISSFVSVSEGVTGISNISIEYENHRMVYKCTVTTEGGSQNVEVNLDGLL